MTSSNKHSEFRCLGEPESALIHGRLLDVDPEKGTAILDAYINWRVPLRFDASLEDKVFKLDGKFVAVEGHGWINDADEWIAIVIEHINLSANRPFDLSEFLNNPAPKIFDPDKVPPMTMSDKEWESFDRALRENRGRRES